MYASLTEAHVAASRAKRALRYAGGLVILAAAYIVLAKASLSLASLNPSASPVWPPTGLALAAVLLWGNRVWPAIFVGAVIANITTAGTLATSCAIALGNTAEAVVAATLVGHLSGGKRTFDTPGRVAIFALVCAVVAAPISATVGVASLALGGFADPANLAPVWLTWWLGDLSGGLIVAPVIVLWVAQGRKTMMGWRLHATAMILGATAIIGVLALSPLLPQTPYRSALAFLAIAPLFAAALYRGRRDTATAALLLCSFAVWGAAKNGGPFSGIDLNETFLLLVAFMVAISVPSLALAADISVRRIAEREMLAMKKALDEREESRARALEDARTALARTETNYRLLVDSVREYAIIMLDTEGRIASWSPGAARIEGYEAHEILGKHFSVFYTDTDCASGQPQREFVLATREGKVEIEGLRVRKDGSRFWAVGTMSAVGDEEKKLIGFVLVLRDITGRRDTQRALVAAREQLLQSQKMEAIGQLTGGVAHDFNNLLMIVSGHAQVLRMRLADPKVRRSVEAIEAAAKRGEALTRQLLTFARRQKLSPEVIDLKERVLPVREMLASVLREDIALDFAIPADIWPVKVDAGELELALVNIAVNARDAMPEGGAIRFAAANVSFGETNSVEGLTGDFVALSVEDTGSGIAPELLPKVFEPFFTTKSVDKGTGLGLSQVYGFAHQSGGAVVVESEVGRGTRVTIYLPRSGALPSAKREERLPAAGRGQGTILVVEDNAEVMEATASMLEEMGYEVARASNAETALARLEAGQEVRLVFSDVVMPGAMNGVSLAHQIRSRYPGIGVLLTTGYSDVADHALGGFPILKKPFEFASLDAALKRAMQRVSAGAA